MSVATCPVIAGDIVNWLLLTTAVTYDTALDRVVFKTKSPTYYFIDLGLRNYLLDIRSFDSIGDKGFLFQNFVFNELKKNIRSTAESLRFWRTKQGAEVDIVIDRYPAPIGIEVKYAPGEKAGIGRSMRSFIGKYESKEYFVVCLSKGKIKEIIPYYGMYRIA